MEGLSSIDALIMDSDGRRCLPETVSYGLAAIQWWIDAEKRDIMRTANESILQDGTSADGCRRRLICTDERLTDKDKVLLIWAD